VQRRCARSIYNYCACLGVDPTHVPQLSPTIGVVILDDAESVHPEKLLIDTTAEVHRIHDGL
jgi:hypothetical protein